MSEKVKVMMTRDEWDEILTEAQNHVNYTGEPSEAVDKLSCKVTTNWKYDETLSREHQANPHAGIPLVERLKRNGSVDLRNNFREIDHGNGYSTIEAIDNSKTFADSDSDKFSDSLRKIAEIDERFPDFIQRKLADMCPVEAETAYQCYDCERYLGDLHFDAETKATCPRNVDTGALQVICADCAKEDE